MSRFSHRQPVWTFGPVVLLSTLLLSPVMASVVLRALIESLPQGSTAALILAETVTRQSQEPNHTPSTGKDALVRQPGRVEDESFDGPSQDGEHLLPPPENEPDLRSKTADTLTDIALLLPQRIVVMVLDDPRLTALFDANEGFPRPASLPPIPPRAPPIAA